MQELAIPFLYSLFFISGAAALIYQIAWVRSLSLIFGGSHLAVTTVVAIFMAGLALGGHLAAQCVPRSANRLRLYAVLELGIACGALLFEAFLPRYAAIYTPLAGLAPETPAFLTVLRVTICIIALLPITTLMGATLPVLVDFCAERPALLGRRLSALYATNTLGAVCGVLLAGFVLLPNTSLSITIGVALCANFLVAGGAWVLSRRLTQLPLVAPRRAAEGPFVRPADGLAPFILWGAAVSGFCALAYEVLWTRVLVVCLGATDYGFSAILTAFLVGIGAGSILFNRLPSTWRPSGGGQHVSHIRVFAAAQIVIGALVAGSVAGLYDLPAYYHGIRQTLHGFGLGPFTVWQLANLVMAFTYLGLPAVIMGFSFPLAGALFGPYCRSTATAVGRVASLNTVGAIIGASVAGFLLIPAAGIERSIHLVIIVNLAFGVLLLLRASSWPRSWPFAPFEGVVLMVALLGTPTVFRAWDPHFFAVYRSSFPDRFSSPGTIADALKRYRVLYYGEGSSAIVAATQSGSVRIFSTNGRVEASTTVRDMQNQLALGHLPMLLHPKPQRVLVVGGGSGMTLGATSVYPDLERVTLVELEPKVLGVIKAFKDFNHDVLHNNKLHVVINDGRNYLLTTAERYDVITSDPIHPSFRGAGYLFTREYFDLVAARLNPGGLMAQWLPLYQMTPDHIRSLLASFSAAFKHTSLWLLYSDALIVGSNSPISIDLDRIDVIESATPEVATDLQQIFMGVPMARRPSEDDENNVPSPARPLSVGEGEGEGDCVAGIFKGGRAENILAYYLAGDAGVSSLVAGARINTDDNLYLEFATPRAFGVPTEAQDVAMLSAARESALPVIRSINPDRIAKWRQVEAAGTLQQIDRVQSGVLAVQHNEPWLRSLASELDNTAALLGRWQLVRAHLFAARDVR
jgi:spermidine synthase